MIQGLYETHLFVENLETSIHFYENVLGLTPCYFEEERRIAFFWVGKPREAMLGLWEKPKSQIYSQHFAFRCDEDFILNKAVDFLNERNLRPYNFLKDGSHQPMVFAWMPAIAIYFNDPDGHQLEFISVLEGEPKPELGVITYDNWLNSNLH
ncbi:VOC family protein [Niabella sp. 22666]|uniref:VOC family protein n=1 Tax=Niabella sp. 22666 TaxID=3453954 RepID=UPI003F8592B4